MKQLSKLSLITPLCLMLLCSAAPVQMYSSVMEGTVKVREKIGTTWTSYSIAGTSIAGQTAATLSLTSELYRNEFNSVIFTGESKKYSFIYRIDVELNDRVQYKGGFLWFYTVTGATKLRYLSVSGKISGITNVISRSITPTPDYKNHLTGNSIPVRASLPQNYSKGLLKQNMYVNPTEFVSESYSNTIYGDNKFDAYVSSSFESDGTFKTYIDYSRANGDYFAGPLESDWKMKISIYGALNFYSDTRPNQMEISVDMGNSVTPDKETYNSKFNDLGTSVKNNASF